MHVQHKTFIPVCRDANEDQLALQEICGHGSPAKLPGIREVTDPGRVLRLE